MWDLILLVAFGVCGALEYYAIHRKAVEIRREVDRIPDKLLEGISDPKVIKAIISAAMANRGFIVQKLWAHMRQLVGAHVAPMAKQVRRFGDEVAAGAAEEGGGPLGQVFSLLPKRGQAFLQKAPWLQGLIGRLAEGFINQKLQSYGGNENGNSSDAQGLCP